MRFKEWLINEILTGHAFDRIRDRMQMWPTDISILVKKRVDVCDRIYNDGRSWAVQVYELPHYVHLDNASDHSNGDWVVAIIRPKQIMQHIDAEVRTVMLRRSPHFPDKPQPFTPEALDVDAVVTLQELKQDYEKLRAGFTKADVHQEAPS